MNLLPQERRASKPAAPRLLNLALLILALSLLVGAVALPLMQKRQAIRQLEPILASARQQAEAAQALRKKLDALRVQSHFLVEKKRGSLLVVEVLNDIQPASRICSTYHLVAISDPTGR